jgi:hypothetical protein
MRHVDISKRTGDGLWARRQQISIRACLGILPVPGVTDAVFASSLALAYSPDRAGQHLRKRARSATVMAASGGVRGACSWMSD